MSNPRDVDDDIERRIRERDQLLAHAQRAPERGTDQGRIEFTILAEQERMAARIAMMEEALRLFADEEWLARATIAELVMIARAALDGRSVRLEEHWLARVERIAATA